jgi:hypothetical protein
MKNPKYEDIRKKMEAWESHYSQNNERAKKGIDFYIAGNQWDEKVVTQRGQKNKESLTFNMGRKHLLRAITQLNEIEFSINLVPTNDAYNQRVEETNAFRLILGSILLNDETRQKMTEAGKNCLKAGYAYAEVTFRYADDDSMCLEPYLIVHKDYCNAFWDMSAPNPTKTDGRFCGRYQYVSGADLIKCYPSTKNKDWVKETGNRVVDYYYRDYETKDFILLNNGQYKSEELLTYDDKNNLGKGTSKLPKRKTREICCIYKKRFCEEYDLESPKEYPTKGLPLIYHPGLTEWTKDGDFTAPYCYHMDGAQKLHNYTLSQAATQAKQIAGPKYFFNKSHVMTQKSKRNAANINETEGSLTFDDDVSTVRREDPAQLSLTVVELSQIAKQEIDEINGAMIDSENAQQTVISGKALDKITHNTEIINAYFTASQIVFCNEVSKRYREMIPELYTEERTIIAKKKDGTGQAIVINQDAGTGDLINNIKDINNNFHYELTAGANSVMQRDNTNKLLMAAYAIDPTLLKSTADILFRNSQSPDSGELELRAIASMDNNLIKFSQGEISLEQYQQIQQKKQAQAMQTQAQMASSNPQAQSAQMMAQAHTQKAMAEQYNAQTRRIETIGKLQEAQQNLQKDLVKLMLDHGSDQGYQEIEHIRNQLQLNQQYIDQLGQTNAAAEPSTQSQPS